jgi:hypothetical protein
MSDDKKPKPKWVKSPTGVAEYYVNTSLVMWSLDDVRFRLGQLVNAVDDSSDEDFVAAAQERAAVTMSWRNAKVLRNQLDNLIKLYEDVNGEINVDPKLAEAKKVEKTN